MAKKKAVKQIVKPMKKTEIFKYLAEKLNMKKQEVENFMNELTQLAYKQCKDPKGFTIPGLGKLLLKQRKARMSRNPFTGEQIKIKAKKVLKFRVAKQAKLAIVGEQPKPKVVKAKPKKK